MKPFATTSFQSGQRTARAAAAILVGKGTGFIVPTAKQRQNVLVAFAKKGKVVYGKAFDVVKLSEPIDLDDLTDIESNLEKITVFEIKSSRRKLRADLRL
jgi:hypothetical protein